VQRPVGRTAGRWIAGGALAALLVADVAWAESRDDVWTHSGASLAAFAGHWVRTEVERDDAARNAEIARVTEPMNFVTRSFARSLMRRRMQPETERVLTLATNALRVRVDGEERPALQPDGRLRATDAGEVTDRWLSDGRIEHTWSRGGDEGHGVVVWEVTEDGALVAHVVVMNPHYEGAMKYTTTYRRAGDAPLH
jgi:hypothetical protein